MKHKTLRYSAIITGDTEQLSYKKLLLAFLFATFLFTIGGVQAQTGWPHLVESKDGVPISYEVHGSGEPTLVFVHGWSCDARYWQKQIPAFTQKHKLVVIDLAGHGNSGIERDTFSMQSFGEDVKSVVEAIGSENIILIGHSMGGAVIAEAARLMPKRVKGLIGVDTYDNIEYPLSNEEFNMMMAPLKKDFKSGTRQFVQQMLSQNTDSQLNEWIKADMSAAPSSIALSAMEEYLSQFITGHTAKLFDSIQIPVMAISCDMWPINYEANRRHMFSFDAIVIKKADHFLMMNRSDEFNKALKQAIKSIVENVISLDPWSKYCP